MSDTIIIWGPPKTGTSSLLGLLNLHPDIFLMSECFQRNRIKRADIYLRHFKKPAIHPNKTHYNVFYPQVQQHFGWKYKYFGDKYAMLEPPAGTDRYLRKVDGCKVIFTFRDPQTWLQKDTVRSKFKLDKGRDVKEVLDWYKYFYEQAQTKDNCLIINLEDFILRNDQTITRLEDFLHIDLKPYTDQWWQKIGTYKDPNKQIDQWWVKRDSCFREPKELDI